MTSLELVYKLLEQTRQMLEVANRDDWDAVEQLHSERAPLLAQLERLDLGTDSIDTLRTALLEVRALNQQLSELADQRKDTLYREKHALGKGRQMQNAYKL